MKETTPAEKSKLCPVEELPGCALSDPTAKQQRSLGETEVFIPKVECKERPEDEESSLRPRLPCELNCRSRWAIAQCCYCEKRCCRKCLEGEFKCFGGSGYFECKACAGVEDSDSDYS